MLPPNPGPSDSVTPSREGALTPVNAYAPPAVLNGAASYSAGKPELLTAKPDPIGLMRALRTNWAVALLAASAIGVGCFALGWFFIPITYESQALVEVRNLEPGSDLNDEKHRPTKDEVQAFRETQLAIVKSPTVLNAVLANPSVANLKWIKREPDKVKWLQNNLIVGYTSEDAEYLRIMMRDFDPQQMQVIVNAVHDEYLKHYNDNAWQEKIDKKNLLQQQRDALLSELRQLHDGMHDILREIGGFDDDDAANRERVLAVQLSGLRQQLTSVSSESRKYQAQALGWDLQRRRYADPERLAMMVDRYLDEEPEIQALSDEIRAWSRAISREQQRTVRATAYVRGLRGQLAQMQQELNEMKEAMRPAATEQFRMEMLDQIEAEFQTVALAFQNARQFEAQTQEQIGEIELALDEVRKYNTDVSQAEEKIEPIREVKNDLEAKLRQLNMELQLGSRENQRRVRSVYRVSNEEARLKYRPLANYVIVSFCGVAGFGLTFGGFALASFYRRRVSAAEQMESGLDVRVLGVVPQLSTGLQNRLTKRFGDGAAAMNEVIADSIDGVRTFLLHAAGANPPRVVMVTSANEQEAKTTVASQLAASLARSGRRTLLIDGDLRRPAVHELFEIGDAPGLCEAIRGEVGVDDVVTPAPGAERLYLAPAGRCNRAAIQGLENEEVRGRVFGPLRAKFDYIIIDTASVLAAADTLSLGQFVDAAIVSVRRDFSRLPRVYEACERMRAVGIDVLGCVVSGENSPELRGGGPLLVGETV